jgi:3-deoxy-D-manno-octulosonic acid kinase
MRAIDAQIQPLPAGGIVYDAARIRKPTARLFSRDFWASQGALHEVRGGRGSVCFVTPGDQVLPAVDSHQSSGEAPAQALDSHQSSASVLDSHRFSGAEKLVAVQEISAKESVAVQRISVGVQWVLRHYRRGGMVAKILRDSYLWAGAERTRCFREWRLLAELHRRGLPVPAPIAAKYERSGLVYRADLITERLLDTQTLTQWLAQGPLPRDRWIDIGRTIARFHAQGVHHADLNAHNLLLDANRAVFLLDFDRGRLRERGAWEQQVLARLRRSLEKVTATAPAGVFGDRQWHWLMEGLSTADPLS